MTNKILLLVLLLSVASSQKILSNWFKQMIQKDSAYVGQVAVVTGGSTGIGYATALQLAQGGAKVVFCARDKNPTWYNGSHAERTINSDQKVQQNGGLATFFKADITKPHEIKALINFTHALHGQIDIVILNAGIGGWSGQIHEMPDEVLFGEKDSLFNNLYGGVICLSAFTKYWMNYGGQNETYSIVMLTSYNGIRACQGCDLYSASKHGIIGLIESTALEYATTSPRIRINGIAPGLTNTFLTRNQVKPDPDVGEAITEDHPLWIEHKDEFASGLTAKRLAEPSEIAAGVVFLASKEASYISGTVLSIDAGDSAK